LTKLRAVAEVIKQMQLKIAQDEVAILSLA
jgi:hypothetical protein